ncbi:MAG: D-2-hydroxyacid dehydrogenase [Clostridiales bacterium]|nr:D-2-hydroxyacid dehydrogenase [Clostridiales bacterium]
MKIVITDGYSANPGDLDWNAFESLGEFTVYDLTPADKLIERTRDADAIITNKALFTEEILKQLPKLKYIGVTATGFNVIDLDACKRRGIPVTNVPEYGTFATAQMTVALLLELTNKVGLHNASVKDGGWVRSEQFCYWLEPLTELYGKSIAVVGMGKIGSRVAKIAEALGMKVLPVPHRITDPSEEYTFEEAIPQADVITLHCPLTPETTNLINSSSLSLAKNGVYVINASRGPIVNETDMAEALRRGKVAGFGCDVVSTEPMKEDNPLLTAPNTVITPHIAWAARETRRRLLDVVASNLKGFIDGKDGKDINRVNM